MTDDTTPSPEVVSRQTWLARRRELLEREKEVTRARERLSEERRRMPWVRVDKRYEFDTPGGRKTLDALFGNCSQLVVHHLMFHPDWEQACVGCTFQADHIDGPRPHLAFRDVSVVAVSRAPLAKLSAYRERLGWQFEWVSSHDSDFNFDFGVSFTKQQIEAGGVEYNFGTITLDERYQSEELPGVSVFIKGDDGHVYHTYSTFARGLDELIGAHHYLDLTPRGRTGGNSDEVIRRRDEYDD